MQCAVGPRARAPRSSSRPGSASAILRARQATAGTLAALPRCIFFVRPLGPLAVLATGLVVAAIGVWAAAVVVRTRRARRTRRSSSSTRWPGCSSRSPRARRRGSASRLGVDACSASSIRPSSVARPHRAERRLPGGWGVAGRRHRGGGLGSARAARAHEGLLALAALVLPRGEHSSNGTPDFWLRAMIESIAVAGDRRDPDR